MISRVLCSDVLSSYWSFSQCRLHTTSNIHLIQAKYIPTLNVVKRRLKIPN